MSLSDVVSIGSLASAIAVLVSLIFVGLQVMQNMRAILSENARSFADSIASDENHSP
jgi:hypothetical protein